MPGEHEAAAPGRVAQLGQLRRPARQFARGLRLGAEGIADARGGGGAHALVDADELQFVGDGAAVGFDDFEPLALPDLQVDRLALRGARLAAAAPVQDRRAGEPEQRFLAGAQHDAEEHELRVGLAGQRFVERHVGVGLQLGAAAPAPLRPTTGTTPSCAVTW